MGLFSKKTYICSKCNKEIQSRLPMFEPIYCNDCYMQENAAKKELKATTDGYSEYRERLYLPEYTSDELRAIIAHRERILEKYKNNSGVSIAELRDAGDNYKTLSDEQCEDIIKRSRTSLMSSTLGAIYNSDFFLPTSFHNTIVDSEDVFAVAFTTDKRIKIDGNEVILCAVFSNDPYIPVFPMVCVGKKGFLEISKSKKGRENVVAAFEEWCPNLKYPVQEVSSLSKTIKANKSVLGNVDYDFMIKQLHAATGCNDLFDTTKLHADLLIDTMLMLDKYGYITDNKINELLKLDKMFNRSFWEKQMKRITG